MGRNSKKNKKQFQGSKSSSSTIPKTTDTKTGQSNQKPKRPSAAPAMKLDSRHFSREAYEAMKTMITNEQDPCYLTTDYHKKASGLVQGLTAYISTWGLHRLVGDVKKFLGKESEDTKYKGKVYKQFLLNLKKLSGKDFDVNNEGSLVELPLREYTALSRLAIQLANEWSFWAPSILGEAEEG